MKQETVKCEICQETFTGYTHLSKHIGKKHDITKQEYFDLYLLKDIKDKYCLCGKENIFYRMPGGYRKMCSPHCGAARSGELNNRYGNHEKIHSEEFKERQRQRAFGFIKNRGGKGTKKKNLIVSDELRTQRSENLKSLHGKGLIPYGKGARCTKYTVNGEILMGKYELYFYLQYEEGVLWTCDPIPTPYGWYTPDFEMFDCFVEIKSTYTLKTCKEGIQYDKIKWVNENIFPVKIKILNGKNVRNFLKTIDLKKYEYNVGMNIGPKHYPNRGAGQWRSFKKFIPYEERVKLGMIK